MRLLEEQRAAIAKEAEAQRVWQAAESKKAGERHDQSMRVAIDPGKTNWVSQVGVGILGAIVALLAVWVAARINPPPHVTVQPAQVVFPPAPTPPDVGH